MLTLNFISIKPQELLKLNFVRLGGYCLCYVLMCENWYIQL